MVVIVDYGLGNLGSIHNMLKKIGVSAKISGEHGDISNASKLILPGVGSFDDGMEQLAKKDLISLLNEKVLNQKIPILGICLGMQLMTQKSEEGYRPGLGWIKADTIKFNFKLDETVLKVPHMGWNIVNFSPGNPLLQSNEEQRFYFVHSYYVKLKNQEDELGHTSYGINFTSAFYKENIFGVQFHPEKSHKFGLNLLTNFNAL